MIRKLESTPNDDLSAPKRESKSPGWMKTQLITQDRIQIWVRPLGVVRSRGVDGKPLKNVR